MNINICPICEEKLISYDIGKFRCDKAIHYWNEFWISYYEPELFTMGIFLRKENIYFNIFDDNITIWSFESNDFVNIFTNYELINEVREIVMLDDLLNSATKITKSLLELKTFL
jgi:hypothetical protein